MKNLLFCMVAYSLTLIIILLSSCSKKQIYPEIVIDIDGNSYNTIKIGDQLWMKENLRTTHFTNGDEILTTPRYQDIGSEINPIYQWSYFEDKENPAIYGRFYTWYAIKESRRICPEGWHVPSSAEWDKMINFLGGNIIAGGILKETINNYWGGLPMSNQKTNGFDAVPTGVRLENGFLMHESTETTFWASDDYVLEINGQPTYLFALNYSLRDQSSEIKQYATRKNSGMVVRCVSDQ